MDTMEHDSFLRVFARVCACTHADSARCSACSRANSTWTQARAGGEWSRENRV